MPSFHTVLFLKEIRLKQCSSGLRKKTRFIILPDVKNTKLRERRLDRISDEMTAFPLDGAVLFGMCRPRNAFMKKLDVIRSTILLNVKYYDVYYRSARKGLCTIERLTIKRCLFSNEIHGDIHAVEQSNVCVVYRHARHRSSMCPLRVFAHATNAYPGLFCVPSQPTFSLCSTFTIRLRYLLRGISSLERLHGNFLRHMVSTEFPLERIPLTMSTKQLKIVE